MRIALLFFLVLNTHAYSVLPEEEEGYRSATFGSGRELFGAWFRRPPPPSPSPPPPTPRLPPPASPRLAQDIETGDGISVIDGKNGEFLQCVADSSVTTTSTPSTVGGTTIATQCCIHNDDGPQNEVCRRYISTNNDEGCISGHAGTTDPQARTYSEAYWECSSRGLQLCEKPCNGQGCYYDHYPVWTRTPCKMPPSPSPPPSPPPSPSHPPPSLPPPSYALEWVDGTMPRAKENSGIAGNPRYYAKFSNMKLRLTLNGEAVPSHTVSFSLSKSSPWMSCSFGAMSNSYYQANTDANGYITLGGSSSYVHTLYSSGTCTISANPNIDSLDPLTGVLTSTAPIPPDVVDGATLSATSAQSGMSRTLGLDGDRLSGILPAHSVLVSDANGEPLADAHVVWSVHSSGGLQHQFSPAGGLATQTIISSSNGVASLNLMSGGSAKVYSSTMTGFTTSTTIRATYNGQSVDFTTDVTGPTF